MSASLDLPDDEWEMLQLSGAWARERHVVARRLTPGRASIASPRGTSGAEHNPFIVLRRPATTEEDGEAIGLNLVYSGDFLAEAEVDSFGTARARIGIDPAHFTWTLEPGGELTLPEAVLAWSGDGLGALSDAYHALYTRRLARGTWRDALRPIVVNNWEGTYFDFDADKLVAMAEVAAGLGIELFVLDDGWFGERDSDDTLARRLDRGPAQAPRRARRGRAPDRGPGDDVRAVDRAGDGQRAEPALRGAPGVGARRPRPAPDRAAPAARPGHGPAGGRGPPVHGALGDPRERPGPLHQVGLQPVHDRGLLRGAPAGSPGGGPPSLHPRHVRAVPPAERGVPGTSCSSRARAAGGRFDPGMLAYAPQAWTSDDTDAVERLRIQWGTSLAYPLSSMGAHVSAVPNHQVGRVTSLAHARGRRVLRRLRLRARHDAR